LVLGVPEAHLDHNWVPTAQILYFPPLPPQEAAAVLETHQPSMAPMAVLVVGLEMRTARQEAPGSRDKVMLVEAMLQMTVA